jgi:hypothetical protein
MIEQFTIGNLYYKGQPPPSQSAPKPGHSQSENHQRGAWGNLRVGVVLF